MQSAKVMFVSRPAIRALRGRRGDARLSKRRLRERSDIEFVERLDSDGDLTGDTALRTLVNRFDEQTVVSLLIARFRSFIALGYPETEALLAAVGYST